MSNRPGVHDIGSVRAGHATTHLAATPDAQTTRESNRANARGNLAAFAFERAGITDPKAASPDDPRVRAGMQDWRVLADILGLDSAPPGRDPGLCRCGTPLPVSTTNSRRDLRRLGLCSTCAKAGETA